MTLALVRSGVWSAALGGLGAFAWALVAPIGRTLPTPLASRPDHFPPAPGYPADSLVDVALGGDLFRPERKPAGVAYDLARLIVPEAAPTPKPALALLGIVGGAAASAVIEGLPGVDGWRVVRRGDVVASLRIKTIARDSVVIVGMDTVWVLKVRDPWKN